MKRLIKIALVVVAIVIVVALFSDDKKPNIINDYTPQPISATSRPFYMGFTSWPPDLTKEAVEWNYQFISAHSDIIAHHFDAGVPWLEALENNEFSQHVLEDWNRKNNLTDDKLKVYLAITPVNNTRDGLALYWGQGDNQALPAPWDKYKFNDEEVKKAYLNYAQRIIKFFEPDYFALSIEANLLLSKDVNKWNEYKELHKYIYTELKKSHPNLPIFGSIQYGHLLGVEDDSKKNAKYQKPELEDLLAYHDIIALSEYQYDNRYARLSENYFETALSFNKPVALAESGALSKNSNIGFTTLQNTQQDQDRFISFVLDQAAKNDFEFVINWSASDFEKLLNRLPKEVRDLGNAWVYTGLVDDDQKAKSSLNIWDTYLHLPTK